MTDDELGRRWEFQTEGRPQPGGAGPGAGSTNLGAGGPLFVGRCGGGCRAPLDRAVVATAPGACGSAAAGDLRGHPVSGGDLGCGTGTQRNPGDDPTCAHRCGHGDGGCGPGGAGRCTHRAGWALGDRRPGGADRHSGRHWAQRAATAAAPRHRGLCGRRPAGSGWNHPWRNPGFGRRGWLVRATARGARHDQPVGTVRTGDRRDVALLRGDPGQGQAVEAGHPARFSLECRR